MKSFFSRGVQLNKGLSIIQINYRKLAVSSLTQMFEMNIIVSLCNKTLKIIET